MHTFLVRAALALLLLASCERGHSLGEDQSQIDPSGLLCIEKVATAHGKSIILVALTRCIDDRMSVLNPFLIDDGSHLCVVLSHDDESRLLSIVRNPLSTRKQYAVECRTLQLDPRDACGTVIDMKSIVEAIPHLPDHGSIQLQLLKLPPNVTRDEITRARTASREIKAIKAKAVAESTALVLSREELSRVSGFSSQEAIPDSIVRLRPEKNTVEVGSVATVGALFINLNKNAVFVPADLLRGLRDREFDRLELCDEKQLVLGDAMDCNFGGKHRQVGPGASLCCIPPGGVFETGARFTGGIAPPGGPREQGSTLVGKYSLQLKGTYLVEKDVSDERTRRPRADTLFPQLSDMKEFDAVRIVSNPAGIEFVPRGQGSN
jgi:hypothetical protein